MDLRVSVSNYLGRMPVHQTSGIFLTVCAQPTTADVLPATTQKASRKRAPTDKKKNCNTSIQNENMFIMCYVFGYKWRGEVSEFESLEVCTENVYKKNETCVRWHHKIMVGSKIKKYKETLQCLVGLWLDEALTMDGRGDGNNLTN